MSLNPSDYAELNAACGEMDKVCDEMERSKTAFGLARAVVEFSSDQRKAALSAAMMPFLAAGESAVSAETHARADKKYSATMKKLKADYAHAEEVVAQYYALKARWETARSRASAEKAMATL